MRFQTGETFTYYTTSAAATCSFNLTAATRKIVIDHLVAYGDKAGTKVTVQASGTTKWEMDIGSAGLPLVVPGLHIENDAVPTLSFAVTGASAAAYIAIGGQYIQL